MKKKASGRGLKIYGHVFNPIWWTKYKVIKLRG
jgi:hypothetical protein